jgi:hypothetical protein
MRAFLNSIMLAAVFAGQSELEFTDGGSSESITYTALDGLVIPGYATSASVDTKIASAVATIDARMDAVVVTTNARIDTVVAGIETIHPPTAAPTKEPTKNPTKNPTKAPTASPTTTPTAPPTASPTVLGWADLKQNNQGATQSTTDTFTPFRTSAIRIQKSGADSNPSNDGWFRATEISAWDSNGNRIHVAGCRTDNWHGAWRTGTWAPELYDNNKGWGNDIAVHFHNHATCWFGRDVDVSKLQFSQGPNNAYALSNWKWQKYNGPVYSAAECTQDNCQQMAVRQYGSKVLASRNGVMSVGTWSWVPGGCSVQSGGDWSAHFNQGTQSLFHESDRYSAVSC